MLRKNWTYEETIIAFDLYAKIPWEKINSRNPVIVEVAKKLGRTSAALSMKLDNLARLDSAVISKGFSSLTHGAKLEEQIWYEFYQDRDLFLEKVNSIVKNYGITKFESNIEEHDLIIPQGATKEVVTKIRIGQNFFRNAVLSAYNFKCCITGICVTDLLVASHIKPWAKSSAQEKTDPHNGLCFNTLHDKVFDKGYMTLKDDYTIIVSDKLKRYPNIDEVTKKFIVSCEGHKIFVPNKFMPTKEFLEYHRDVIFKR